MPTQYRPMYGPKTGAGQKNNKSKRRNFRNNNNSNDNQRNSGGGNRNSNRSSSSGSRGRFDNNRRFESNRNGNSSNNGGGTRYGFGNRGRGGRGGRRGRNVKKANTTPASHYVSEAQPLPKKEKKQKLTLSYESLDLKAGLLKNLHAKGYTHTTEIQAAAIPIILSGSDLLGISATGSGKTAAFLVPMVQKLSTQKTQRLLVIAPTRELAMQIHTELVSLIKGSPLRAALIIGGSSMGKQIRDLKGRVDIIIGTPGRLHDMQRRGHLHLDLINNIVLDEVDRMLDMGFVDEIRDIFRLIADKRQSLFFSATIEHRITQIVGELVDEHETIKFGENEPGKYVTQAVVGFHDTSEKMHKLFSLLDQPEVEKSIVFVETKKYVDKVTEELTRKGYKAEAIHGGKTQGRRLKAIKLYRSNHVNILVATNVAARGLDITDITHVINFDEPQTYDEYIHRIGRTGRNGKTGFAYTFIEAHRIR